MAEQEKNSTDSPGEERMSAGQPMQSIGQILTNMQNDMTGKSTGAGLQHPTWETKSGDCECKGCGKTFTGEIKTYRFPPGWEYKVKPGMYAQRPDREFKTLYCPECKAWISDEGEKERQRLLAAERVEAVDRWRKTCGITEDLAAKTFDNFESDWQPNAFRTASSWAEKFNLENPRSYPSLIFYSSEPGLGKTHLMVAIANYLFDNWMGSPGRERSPIIFVKGPRLVRRIRWTYNLPPEDYKHEREEDVYREVTGVPLLLLDDVGKETPSKFTRETYWYIIDERMTSGLPVIITSRLPLEGDNSLEQLMGEDTVDRLYGMTRGKVTEMTGKSYRSYKRIP